MFARDSYTSEVAARGSVGAGAAPRHTDVAFAADMRTESTLHAVARVDAAQRGRVAIGALATDISVVAAVVTERVPEASQRGRVAVGALATDISVVATMRAVAFVETAHDTA